MKSVVMYVPLTHERRSTGHMKLLSNIHVTDRAVLTLYFHRSKVKVSRLFTDIVHKICLDFWILGAYICKHDDKVGPLLKSHNYEMTYGICVAHTANSYCI